ncbi:transposable element Tcb1 transposase [Trichonephila clavipes]|nr:transposable element Tcb1 transposase [Trichonephila clavipes]
MTGMWTYPAGSIREIGIAQRVISRLWQRFQGDGNARRPVRCVPLTTTHCHLPLAWSREHILYTPQQWSGVMFSDESRTDLHVQSVTITGHIYQDVILEQHVRLFRGAMGAEFLFMDDNTRPHRTNIVDECLLSEDITRMDSPAYSPDLNPIEHVWICLADELQPFNPLPFVYRHFGGHCLMSGVIFPKIRLMFYY